jgi:hypothetical protein
VGRLYSPSLGPIRHPWVRIVAAGLDSPLLALLAVIRQLLRSTGYGRLRRRRFPPPTPPRFPLSS